MAISWRTKRNINNSAVSGRPLPQRTCIACRQVKAKRELMRLVFTDQGKIEVDRSSRMGGRGAYLCLRIGCWEVALKSNRLERALRTSISKEQREQLLKMGKEILEESTSG